MLRQLNSRPLRQAAALLSAAALALVAACGGGGSTATDSSTATNFSQGAISGFGSVIVNGVRWDDSNATVTDDDGVKHASSDLKLGMVVQIDGGKVDAASASGHALAIHFGSEMLGPISAVDSTASTLTVLGQTVLVTTSTVFDTNITGGLAGLTAGTVVEVHGLFDAANVRTVATRIEIKTAATEYRLRGIVAGLDTTAKTFTIGSESVSYAAVADVPSTLANGLQVKLRLQTTQVAGVWQATKLRLISKPTQDRPEAEVEGVITVWTSAKDFEINGLKVDASNATFPDGDTSVVLGARVEVEGAIVGGVLVATKVHLEDDGHDDGHGGTPKLFELHGAISGLDTTAKTFALRGLTVSYAGTVEFKDGTEAKLANGAKVEVKGVLSTDLTRIDATRIQFE